MADADISAPEVSGNTVSTVVTDPRTTLPFPGYEECPTGRYDSREFAKFFANLITAGLNDHPDHPNKERFLGLLEEQKRIASMDEADLRRRELYEANPINKLNQDEKLHCIRTLPVTIVKKLFPYM